MPTVDTARGVARAVCSAAVTRAGSGRPCDVSSARGGAAGERSVPAAPGIQVVARVSAAVSRQSAEQEYNTLHEVRWVKLIKKMTALYLLIGKVNAFRLNRHQYFSHTIQAISTFPTQ